MKQEVMKKWVKALESGRYKKGKNRLCSISENGTRSFCCLGVLCDLYDRDMKSKKKKVLNKEVIPGEIAETFINSNKVKVVVFENNEGTLPEKVIKWAGFEDGNSEGFIDDIPYPLIDLNDGNKNKNLKAKSFKKIASIIKNNYKNI